jgi:hypothetical protein
LAFAPAGAKANRKLTFNIGESAGVDQVFATMLHLSPVKAIEKEAPTVSVVGISLLTLTLFTISFAAIEFTRLSNSIPAIWPSNAILLTALVRSPGKLKIGHSYS